MLITMFTSRQIHASCTHEKIAFFAKRFFFRHLTQIVDKNKECTIDGN